MLTDYEIQMAKKYLQRGRTWRDASNDDGFTYLELQHKTNVRLYGDMDYTITQSGGKYFIGVFAPYGNGPRSPLPITEEEIRLLAYKEIALRSRAASQLPMSDAAEQKSRFSTQTNSHTALSMFAHITAVLTTSIAGLTPSEIEAANAHLRKESNWESVSQILQPKTKVSLLDHLEISLIVKDGQLHVSAFSFRKESAVIIPLTQQEARDFAAKEFVLRGQVSSRIVMG